MVGNCLPRANRSTEEKAVNRTIVRVPLLILIAVVNAAPVLAAGSAPSQTVRFDDLNLSQPRGVHLLYARLESAAANVCGEPQRANSRIVSTEWQACVAQALQRAVRRLDRPALTAYHSARTAGGHPQVPMRVATALRDDDRS
jgi:UrcA family protein